MSYPRIVVDAAGDRVPLLGERVRHYVDGTLGTVIGRAQPLTGMWTVRVLWDDNVNDYGEHGPGELRDPELSTSDL